MTTAAMLIAYRNELIAGGISRDIVDEMVAQAAGELVRQSGLNVREDEPIAEA